MRRESLKRVAISFVLISFYIASVSCSSGESNDDTMLAAGLYTLTESDSSSSEDNSINLGSDPSRSLSGIAGASASANVTSSIAGSAAYYAVADSSADASVRSGKSLKEEVAKSAKRAMRKAVRERVERDFTLQDSPVRMAKTTLDEESFSYTGSAGVCENSDGSYSVEGTMSGSASLTVDESGSHYSDYSDDFSYDLTDLNIEVTFTNCLITTYNVTETDSGSFGDDPNDWPVVSLLLNGSVSTTGTQNFSSQIQFYYDAPDSSEVYDVFDSYTETVTEYLDSEATSLEVSEDSDVAQTVSFNLTYRLEETWSAEAELLYDGYAEAYTSADGAIQDVYSLTITGTADNEEISITLNYNDSSSQDELDSYYGITSSTSGGSSGSSDSSSSSDQIVVDYSYDASALSGSWYEPGSGSSSSKTGACIEVGGGETPTCAVGYNEVSCYNMTQDDTYAAINHYSLAPIRVYFSTSSGSDTLDEDDNLCVDNGFTTCSNFYNQFTLCDLPYASASPIEVSADVTFAEGTWSESMSSSSSERGACIAIKNSKYSCLTDYPESSCKSLTSDDSYLKGYFSTSSGATSTDENDNLCYNNGFTVCGSWYGEYVTCDFPLSAYEEYH